MDNILIFLYSFWNTMTEPKDMGAYLGALAP